MTRKDTEDCPEAPTASPDPKAEVRRWHVRLFPEEYDFLHDSHADARGRRRGINPVSADYAAEVDARRASLGIGPYLVKNAPDPNESWNWVRAKLAAGEQDDLAALADQIEVTTAARVRASHVPVNPDEDRSAALDAYLADRSHKAGRALEPEELAQWIYGFLFSRYQEDIHAEAAAVLRERLTETSDEELKRLLESAFDEWIEAYE